MFDCNFYFEVYSIFGVKVGGGVIFSPTNWVTCSMKFACFMGQLSYCAATVVPIVFGAALTVIETMTVT